MSVKNGIHWREEENRFIIEFDDDYLAWSLPETFSDEDWADPWQTFHELVNGPIFGMQGNSNYAMTEYQWLLDDAAHNLRAKTWFHPPSSYISFEERTRLANEAARSGSKLYLSYSHGQDLHWDARLVVDGWSDDMGDLRRLYHVWVWNSPLNPLEHIQQHLPLEYQQVLLPERWQAEHLRVTYRVDQGEPQEVRVWAAPRENLRSVVAWELWQEYPYVAYKQYHREEANVFGDKQLVRKSATRQKNILTILSKEPDNADI